MCLAKLHPLERDFSPYLLAPVGESRVTPYLPLEVEFTLAVSAEVNGAGLDVDVHQVVDDSALDVILDPVHKEPPPHVDHFDQREIPTEIMARISGDMNWGQFHEQNLQAWLVKHLGQDIIPALKGFVVERFHDFPLYLGSVNVDFNLHMPCSGLCSLPKSWINLISFLVLQDEIGNEAAFLHVVPKAGDS